MKKVHLSKILIPVGMLSILFFLPYLSAQAIEYGGFGGRPAYPRADNSRTDSIFVHTLNPGATQQEGVKVVNNSAETKTMLVYGADSTPSTGGAFACKQSTEEKVDVGSWITLSKSEVTLNPGTNEIIPFTISVPFNASVGEHNGCILIQEKKVPVSGQTGAVLSVRTGLRVVITIPGNITRKLEIIGFTVDKKDGGFVLHPLVKNTGNVSIDANVQVKTKYFFGLPYLKQGGQYPILRDETSSWNFELKKPFWGGWYRSSFSVEYDQNPEASVGVVSGKVLTMLPDTGTGGKDASGLANSSVTFFSSPSPMALVIEIGALLLIGFGGFLIGLRMHRHKKKHKNSK